MNSADGPSLVWGIVSLLMVVSALAARRLPLGHTLKMALAWIAIFAGMFVVFSFRPEIKAIWQRVSSDLAGTANQNIEGGKITLTRGDDGHFQILGTANGKPIQFLVDSGVTSTTISSDAAQDVGVEVDRSSFPVFLDTANGTAKAFRAEIAVFKLNTIELKEMKVLVSDTLGDTNLLGMDFLSGLRSWRVEGDKMILER
jgi:aspartyl protease family protein